MKNAAVILLMLSLCGCSGVPVTNSACPGSVALPTGLAALFDAVEDEALLNAAVGRPDAGGLCAGKVYRANNSIDLTLYRAWNSTNSSSRLGKWWAFDRPDGKVAQYRADYEICYQWSPLDKLTHCKIKSGTMIVVGGGQSATCSPYLTYPSSAVKQIYIDNAAAALADCSDYDLQFGWSPVSR
jgi:hypothetical protein